MTRTHECCLCSQIEGRIDGDLIARLLPDEPYARRIMLESASFAVVPSLGPLVRGHSLLCPKNHVRSFAQVDPSLWVEFDTIKATLRRSLRELYASGITVFEHGMAASGDRILCTVDHAHLHFLPLPAAFDAGVGPVREWAAFDGSLAALGRLSGGHEYISCETPDGQHRLLVSPEGAFEPQFMRKVIAAALGRAGQWNWRDDPDPAAADATWRDLVHA